MTTIKNPQTVSHSKNNNNGGHGFVTFLLLLTWLAIGAGFYGVKMGIIQPDTINPAVETKLTTLDNNISALDKRLATLEKRLAEASSALKPAEQPSDASAPEATKPVEAPAMPEETKQPEGGATAPSPTAPSMTEPEEKSMPKIEENKGTEPVKPQTNNHGASSDQTAVFEKKNYI